MFTVKGIMRRLGRGRSGRGDDGYALPAVIGLGIVMLILAGTAATATSSIQVKAQNETDWNAAYYAATAGLSDYQSRLATISNYNLYGNPNANFSAGSAPLTLPATTDPLYNPAFDIIKNGTWTTVPCKNASCSGSTKPSYFRYEVNTKDFAARGIIHVRATGRSGSVTRSVIADFRRNGLFNFVYYTNYEIQDPTISGAAQSCATYPWSTPARANSCQVVQFGKFDKLTGDIFSNDQFTICGATFTGRIQSAAPSGFSPYTTTGCGTTAQNWTYAPVNSATISLPASNATLSTEARADTYTGAAAGCMYTGPTSIKFNSDGTMTVVSPLTRVTQPSFTSGIPSQSPASCGAIAALNSVAGATFTVPADNLIYVQSVPTSASDPNYTAISSTTSWSKTVSTGNTFSCFGQTGWDDSGASATMAGWKFASSSSTVQYPLANEDYIPTPTGTAAYQCNAGDVYVSGVLKGHVTLATDRNIYVTGNIDYAGTYPTGSSYNLLGLVANVALVIWNPMNYTNTNNISNILTDTDRDLSAAALAVKGTIMVQNYDEGGTRGTLNLIGSIEQNFRGTVATSNDGGKTAITGYKKNYVYDGNLKYNAPPKYLAPANATFAISQIASVPAGFNWDGSPRS